MNWNYHDLRAAVAKFIIKQVVALNIVIDSRGTSWYTDKHTYAIMFFLALYTYKLL